MSKFIIHMGAHKTGTSAFQQWLQQHRDELHSAGYFLPVLGSNRYGNYVQLSLALTEPSTNGESSDQKLRERILESLRRESDLHSTSDLVVSAEAFSKGIGNKRGDAICGTLASRIEKLGREKVSILSVREQQDWLNSRYAQRRKMLIDVPGFEAFARNQMDRGAGNWLEASKTLISHGFDFHAVAYTGEVAKKGIVRELMSLSVFDRASHLAESCEVGRTNESLGAHGLILADVVHSRSLERFQSLSNRAKRHLSRMIITYSKNKLPRSHFNGVTPELADEIFNCYHASNCEFAQQHLGRDWGDLFPAQHSTSELSPRNMNDLSKSEAAIIDELATTVISDAARDGVFDHRGLNQPPH